MGSVKEALEKLVSILEACSFLLDDQKKILRRRQSLFRTVAPS